MTIDGRSVANFVLDICDEQQRPITNLALQKIVFFCHVWSLVGLGKPLVKQNFEAWQYGPVLQYLYREFNDFERSPITSRAKKVNALTGVREVVTYDFDEETERYLRKVVLLYSGISAGNLVELSHAKDGPWDVAWNYGGLVNPGMVIENESIIRYYSAVPTSFSRSDVR